MFFFWVFFLINLSTTCKYKVWKITKGNVSFASAFHDPSFKDCKQSNSMQTRALLNLDKKYCKIFLRAKQLPVKGLIGNRYHALEAVPKRRAIHKLNAYFFLQKIKSECKYIDLNQSIACKISVFRSCQDMRVNRLENSLVELCKSNELIILDG